MEYNGIIRCKVENDGKSRTRNALVVVCAKLWYNKIPIHRDRICAEGPHGGQGEGNR